MSFDEKRGKYKCVDMYPLPVEPFNICYRYERDLAPHSPNTGSYSGWQEFTKDQKLEEPYYNVYDYGGKKTRLIRRACRHHLSDWE